MTVLIFDYVDANGKETNRTIYVEDSPTNIYAGTDLNELSEDELDSYTLARDNLLKEYQTKIQQLNADFDLKHRYRVFLPDNMSNVEDL